MVIVDVDEFDRMRQARGPRQSLGAFLLGAARDDGLAEELQRGDAKVWPVDEVFEP